MGVKWVILGTVAFRNPDLVKESCQRFPGRIILSIDARGERVAILGWYEVVSLKAIDLSKQFEGLGLSAIIFTDVERDGMGTGLNWEMTRSITRATSTPVIAAGGISRMEEIAFLKKLESEGVMGVIVGRALYTGQIKLEEAIQVAGNKGAYKP